MLSQSRMKAVLQAYVDGLNAGDAEAVIALFAPDAVIEDPIGTPEKRGAEIEAWFRAAAKMRARLELAAPIRGSHGNAAAMAFTVTTRFEGQLRTTRSLDTMRFDEHGRITRLEAYWGPEDVETRPA
ncbi:nuclear transport factor 2 family protein [Myxococcota bacterium]|nr:nuclear transport factor 2 family protein [Myxococcota bacterium]